MQVMNGTISSDIFAGQIISPVTIIVLVVLGVLLLREWVLPNAPRSLFDEEPVKLATGPVVEEVLAARPVVEDAATRHVVPDALGCASLHPKKTKLQRIYLARHGLKPNRLGTDWTTPTGLPRDPPLGAIGLTQAEDLGSYFESMPLEERPTAIFSSPFYRCIQTSTPIATKLGIPLYLEHAVGEWNTPVAPGTGLHPRAATATALKAIAPIIDDSWSTTWYVSRSGETVGEFYARTRGFLSAFIPRLESTTQGHERILLVGHAASAIVLLHSLVGENIPHRVGYATVSVLDRTEDGVLGAWKPVGKIAREDHLSVGMVKDWGMEDEPLQDGEVLPEPGEPVTEGDTNTAVGLQWFPDSVSGT